MSNHHILTKLAQTGNRSETTTGAVNPPIYLSTAYRHEGIGQSTGYDYTRTGNPTRAVLEQSIADLEGGESGFAFSSGMAAIQATFGLFEPGDEFIVTQDVYGGSYRLFENQLKKSGLSFNYVNSSNPKDFEQAITDKTKGFFIETPTNPLMTEIDVQQMSEIAAEHELLLIVDNTFYTPYLQRPIELGADLVIHSATKYLGGHNDVLAGLVVSRHEALSEQLASEQNATGAVLSPFDCWLLMRGMKTLGLRMSQHEENAKLVAAFLEHNPYVTDVLYPGQGGMLSFRVESEEAIPILLESFRLISFAESLGGTETFITYPATQTHMDIPEEIRSNYGVCNRLLRLSVGLEYSEDLMKDLKEALEAAHKGVEVHE
ncbi:cystathionine gamma-synthase [Pontibacillus halophilus JSM 076056 = DSM 19796]|uniref:Cystathionine gamma-synthase n=1 Tax=Pontibacillus halophilus JSM 076056 = DSM 19796 TaxID=1385510 RepID=A0A0A5GP04_9BACI|nr:methionine biosynthesis PLP-dependent protein [Pontibacillus halophilus]KGX92963.1 cystathionine gamma-synthase [Pontibacillus halophilus JSM 076056 = DSM 19796]